MRNLELSIFACLLCATLGAQTVLTFDFDNATASGGVITQDIFLNGDGYRLTLTHGSGNGATLTTINNDQYLHSTTGSRTQQNWTVSLIKNGQTENFNFVSIDYLNTSNLSHVFVVGDLMNNAVSNQVTIAANASGTILSNGAASSNNMTAALIFTPTFTGTFDVYFNNLQIAPVSLLSNTDFQNNDLTAFLPNNDTFVLQGEFLRDAQVSIVNLAGQVVHTATVDTVNMQIDLAAWVRGMYVVRVKNGSQVQTLKFVR